MNEAIPYLPPKSKRLLLAMPALTGANVDFNVRARAANGRTLIHPGQSVAYLKKLGLIKPYDVGSSFYRLTRRGAVVQEDYRAGARVERPISVSSPRRKKVYPPALDEDMPTQPPFTIREIYWHPPHGVMCGSPDEPCSCRQPDNDHRPHLSGCPCPRCRGNNLDFCEHPKECPNVCPCKPGCYCKFRSCRKGSSPKTSATSELTELRHWKAWAEMRINRALHEVEEGSNAERELRYALAGPFDGWEP